MRRTAIVIVHVISIKFIYMEHSEMEDVNVSSIRRYYRGNIRFIVENLQFILKKWKKI